LCKRLQKYEKKTVLASFFGKNYCFLQLLQLLQYVSQREESRSSFSMMWVTFEKNVYLCNMKTKTEYIKLIENQEDELRRDFGIRSLRLFGSVSRDEQVEGSDVDVCVEMEPQAYLMVRLKRFLERLLGCSVDVVRMHKHMNPYLLQEINRDGIYVIK